MKIFGFKHIHKVNFSKYKLTNIHIGLFCKPIYLSGTTFEQFRKEFLNNFEFKNGMLFNASCFADVSDKWGINFTVWSNGETYNKTDLLHNLVSEEDYQLRPRNWLLLSSKRHIWTDHFL